MRFDPANLICEVLGEPANVMRNPANADYMCPFLEGQCSKRSQQLSGPFPVCSIFRSHSQREPICVCPNRFNEIDVVADILANCWPHPKPSLDRIKVINEIKLGHLGTMDMVLASVDAQNKIQKFVSVELQAVDITGSYFPAYSALTNSQALDSLPRYGFNWMNVYKRYVTQLINKGFQHTLWGTIIVSVMQDVVLDRILKMGNIVSAPIEQSNVVFLGYEMAWDSIESSFKMKLNKVVGTTHTNIMSGHLYRQTISFDEVARKLQGRI